MKKSDTSFDLQLLDELKGLSGTPADEFDSAVARIMKKKSSRKLWSGNFAPSFEKDLDGNSRRYNYKCCPESVSAKNLFCLLIEHKDGKILVTDGFLNKI